MITRHHLVLVLLCSIIISSAIVDFDPFLAVLVSIGMGIGAIIPDIQMKRPKNNPLRMIAWGMVQAGRRTCIPVICFVYQRFFKTPAKPDDKRVTHSIIGILLYFIMLAAIAYILIMLFKNTIPVILVMGLLAGLLSGMLLHLAEDLCCRKGICLFYPFNDTRIYGSIRPCDVLDKRILGFHVYHATVLFFFLVIQSAIHVSLYEMIAISMFSIGLCVVSMIWQSEVRIGLPESRVTDNQEEIPAKGY
ncbi:MAG: metal-dependent hydrolase [Methanoregula sp.]|nr:metal-dependent hydrolase [Methanoregula sp.]